MRKYTHEDFIDKLYKNNKNFRYKPLKKFNGSSECFTLDILEKSSVISDIGRSDVVGKILDYEYNK